MKEKIKREDKRFLDDVNEEVSGLGDKFLAKLGEAQAHKYDVLASPEKMLAIKEFWLLVFLLLSLGAWLALWLRGGFWLLVVASLLSMNFFVVLTGYVKDRRRFVAMGGEL